MQPVVGARWRGGGKCDLPPAPHTHTQVYLMYVAAFVLSYMEFVDDLELTKATSDVRLIAVQPRPRSSACLITLHA